MNKENSYSYSIVKCQRNKIRGYEVSYHNGYIWGFLGFFKTLKETKEFYRDHKRKRLEFIKNNETGTNGNFPNI